MLSSICSYTPVCSTLLNVVEGYPKTTLAMAIFFAYIGACIYDMRSKGITTSIGRASTVEPAKDPHVRTVRTVIGFRNGRPFVEKSSTS